MNRPTVRTLGIVLIAAAVAVFLPVMNGRPRSHRIGVRQEMVLLATALTEFKHRFGVYPPSRIHLHEDPQAFPYGGHGDQVLDAIDARTLHYLGSLWPEFDPHDPLGVGLNYYDYNGNGMNDGGSRLDPDLNGSECLVFFLGGMPLPIVPVAKAYGGEGLLSRATNRAGFSAITVRGLDGFCLDPHFPFQRSVDVDTESRPMSRRTERSASLFAFVPSQLSDVDLDGFWEYYDPDHEPVKGGTFDPARHPHPYAYFSSYEETGYNVARAEGERVPTYDNSWPTPARRLRGLLWPISRTTRVGSDEPSSFWNSRSYQLISPGADGFIGHGTGPGGAAVFDRNASTLSEQMTDNFSNVVDGTLGNGL